MHLYAHTGIQLLRVEFASDTQVVLEKRARQLTLIALPIVLKSLAGVSDRNEGWLYLLSENEADLLVTRIDRKDELL